VLPRILDTLATVDIVEFQRDRLKRNETNNDSLDAMDPSGTAPSASADTAHAISFGAGNLTHSSLY